PQVAYRVRQNTNTDTPIPPDEAAGENPPDGAIINYLLASPASAVTLEIFSASASPAGRSASADGKSSASLRGKGASQGGRSAKPDARSASLQGGRLVRRYASSDPAERADPATAPVPVYWYRPPQPLPTTPGMHRFLWDLHYQPLRIAAGRGGLPIAAVPR